MSVHPHHSTKTFSVLNTSSSQVPFLRIDTSWKEPLPLAPTHRERQVIPLTYSPKPSKSITFLRSYKQILLPAHQNPASVPLLPAHQNPVRALLLLRPVSNNSCLLIKTQQEYHPYLLTKTW